MCIYRSALVRDLCVILKRIFISVISCLSVILNLISDPSSSKAPWSKRLFYSTQHYCFGLAHNAMKLTLMTRSTWASFTTHGFSFLHKDASKMKKVIMGQYLLKVSCETKFYEPKPVATDFPSNNCCACSYSISQLELMIDLPNQVSMIL